MANEVCFRTMHLDEPWSLKSYESVGGYSTLKRIIKGELSPDHIIEEVKKSNLRGRGGAGFPTGLKWSFVSRDVPGQKYGICNSDESEPGTFKDRDILRYNPHQVIEGIAIGCFTIGATVGYNLMRGEFWEPYHRMERALHEIYEAGWLGRNIQGSGINIDVYNHLTGGAYICGEETALMDSLEGKRGMPRFKPPFPANYGLYGRPTNINNTETYASIPTIMEKGAEWFAQLGTAKSGGTKIFCMSGHLEKPGNYEVGLGIPFAELLELAGGIKDGKKLKAVIPGGSSMPVLPADIIMKTHMDYESLQAAGSLLGSAGVMVLDETTCMVRALERLLKFYMHESCGQCTPCREGSGWVWRIVNRIEKGEGKAGDLEELARIARQIEGRTICVFGEAIAWPIASFLKHFRDEFEYHIQHGKCYV